MFQVAIMKSYMTVDVNIKADYEKALIFMCIDWNRCAYYYIIVQLRNVLFQVAIMKSYMTGGITDISPVINSYTDALLDVFPQVRGDVDVDADIDYEKEKMCIDWNLCAQRFQSIKMCAFS